jgi:hypothetical protein
MLEFSPRAVHRRWTQDYTFPAFQVAALKNVEASNVPIVIHTDDEGASSADDVVQGAKKKKKKKNKTNENKSKKPKTVVASLDRLAS